MGRPASRHHIERVAAGLRRASGYAGVALPVDYSQTVAADGLTRSPELGVTRLGDGVIVHTQPADGRDRPVVVGYADPRGQWYRNGHRRTATPATKSEATSVAAGEQVAR